LESSLASRFLELRNTRDIRIPSSIELLNRLANRYPVAIVSGNSRDDVAEAVDHLQIGSKLAFYLGCEDYAPGKPAPACFLLAADRLQLPPAECVVFEDSAAGVRAAKAAGMTCIALARPGMPQQDLSSADRVLADLAEYDPIDARSKRN
jgi:sugar-phosphatase